MVLRLEKQARGLWMLFIRLMKNSLKALTNNLSNAPASPAA
jgi:hypothetical protein